MLAVNLGSGCKRKEGWEGLLMCNKPLYFIEGERKLGVQRGEEALWLSICSRCVSFEEYWRGTGDVVHELALLFVCPQEPHKLQQAQRSICNLDRLVYIFLMLGNVIWFRSTANPLFVITVHPWNLNTVRLSFWQCSYSHILGWIHECIRFSSNQTPKGRFNWCMCAKSSYHDS